MRLAAAIALGACAVAASALLLRHDAPGPSRGPGAVVAPAATPDMSYVIPAGTGARLDGGARLDLLPARIEARVGDVIRIVNEDDRAYLLGPFYVGGHETLSQRFSSPGTFEGTCAVHSSGRIVLVVEGEPGGG